MERIPRMNKMRRKMPFFLIVSPVYSAQDRAVATGV